MIDENAVSESVGNLLNSQALAVLATDLEGHPYTSLIGFAATPDLRSIYFATTRATRKYRNLTTNTRVSLLIDNRRNVESDFHEACAVTVLGEVEEVEGEERDQAERLYLEKHPALAGFVQSPSCSLLRVHVSVYYFVTRFQNVVELRVNG